MYIAMNRFNVLKDRTDDFVDMWKNRDSYLSGVEGFISFQLLKGPEFDDYILYSSHTLWANHQTFEDWTKSDAFKDAHKNAGHGSQPITLGRPNFEGFEVILNEEKSTS